MNKGAVGYLVLVLVITGTTRCSLTKDPVRGEVQELLDELERKDESVYSTGGTSYSEEMNRLIEIGEPAVPLLVRRLRELQKPSYHGKFIDADTAIVVVLGDIRDPAATEVLLDIAKKWGLSTGPAVEALGKIGGRIVEGPKGYEGFEEVVDFLEELYVRSLTPRRWGSFVEELRAWEHLYVVETLVSIGSDEYHKMTRPYILPILICAAGDKYRSFGGAETAVEALRRWTGQDFGHDSIRWAEWWKQNYRHPEWKDSEAMPPCTTE